MNVTALLLKYKYAILIPLSIPLGPEVNIPASFLASLGYFNIYAVYLIVVVGDVLGDGLWYWLARMGGVHIINKIGARLGVTEEKIKVAENHLHNHFYKTMFLGKLTNIVMLPIIMACGLLKINYRKFLLTALVLDIVKDLIFTVIGYYFGSSYKAIIANINNFSLIATIFLVAIVLLFVVLHYVRKWLSETYEKD